ncbi:Transcriptional regulator, MerR family [Actinokineospora spheciospongiae]|uniref:Transcriptional regulator, MerR family n=1 Tax=Actinokineospora spheciospongiae TaxID=909613 RepID=W7IR08_9PSEU|nr:MerR family transcriptional regulator [Actinokineospora spheciospongiae]EWC63345.1 Transcriptional regulator, MerR family [Actinokineospora spheciospongiae]
MPLRPVDLARHAGISTQQVRNHEAAGVLPEVPRTESGYRRYGPEHLRALLAYRALARALGTDRATAVLHAANAGDPTTALHLVDAAHATLHAERQAAESTAEALGAVADTPVTPGPDRLVGEVAATLSVRTSALRVWEAAGLLTPARDPATGYRRYTPLDVRDARVVAMLRKAHYPFPRITQVLTDLHRTGSREALAAAIAERRAALDAQSLALLEAAGLLHAHLTA